MLDKCVDSAKSGLEGAKEVAGLFRDVQEYLYAFCDSLFLC